MVAPRIIRPSSRFTGRSLGWRALLAAALISQENGDLAKAESLTKKALESAQKYLGKDDIELVPLFTTLADIYKKLGRTDDEKWALAEMRLALKSIEPESDSASEHSTKVETDKNV